MKWCTSFGTRLGVQVRERPPFELFYDELKVTKGCTKTLCLCWFLRSKIAFMRCVTFSNVLYVFGLFMNNQLGHIYISALVSGFASVTEIPGGEGDTWVFFGWVCFGIKLAWVNSTSLRADSQWIIILKTFELVTLRFSQFHAQRNWLLTHALQIFNQYIRLLCCFWSLMWLRNIEDSFFTVCFVRLVIHCQ